MSTLPAARRGLIPLLAALLLAPSLPAAAQAKRGFPQLVRNSVTYGCQWTQSIDPLERNTGYPDGFAQYESAAMPYYLAPAVATITITGRYPKARYFNFTAYDGFRPGNLIDGLQDYQLTPRLAGVPVAAPGAQPAPRPEGSALGYDYKLTLQYTVPPAPPLARDPDTLYMNDQNIHYLGFTLPGVFGAKNLGYRVYLPDAGANDFGDVPLPQITYTAADGTVIDVSNANPQQSECDSASRSQDVVLTVFPQAGFSGVQNTQFEIGAGFTVYRVYPNPGSNYARAQTTTANGDMVVARFKRQPTVGLVPDPQVRYNSLCQYQFINSALVACLSDQQFVEQADGYVVAVVSPEAKRPAKATAANGYNYLRWGPATQGLLYLRQILANPDWEGDYVRAAGKSGDQLPPILGDWAPDASYCDATTFDAFADQGGAALLAACKANYRRFANGANRPDPN